jgi:hypothetical protein
MKPEVTVQRAMDATVLEENYHKTPTALGHRLVGLLRAVTVPAAPVEVAAPLIMVTLVAEIAAAELLTQGWQESRWRRRSRRLRPHRQPRHWHFTQRL